MNIRKGLLGGIAGLAASAAIALIPAAAFAAGGPPPGHGGGGGGGGETTVANNLSVPAVFIGTQPGFGLTNPALQYPTGQPAYVTTPNVLGSGWYWLQGTASKWQAQYAVQATDTATAKWGDNLAGGSASLRAGHPVRVEMGLTSTTHVADMQGFQVIKLDDNLADRVSPYGTPATANADGTYSATAVTMPARVWGPGATLSINGGSPVAMPGEINATGAIVFGYNWRPSEPGSYTLTFHPPSGVTVTEGSLSITVTVRAGAGGGGR